MLTIDGYSIENEMAEKGILKLEELPFIVSSRLFPDSVKVV